MIKKCSYLISILLLLLTFCGCGSETTEGNIVILYTNDVHCHIDDEESIGYAGLADIEEHYAENGAEVLLVDAGDAIQGGHIGAMTEGSVIIAIMNELGYDAATIGNHEFDYGASRLLELSEQAEFPYVSCNFRFLESGETVFAPYTIIEAGNTRIAFVGIATPNTLTSCAPVQFQNEAGEMLYSFDEGASGRELYDSVTQAAAAARAEGADYVIALAHLGLEEESAPWRSTDVIANTEGIDAVIDGHSHDAVESKWLTDKNGDSVLLTQTGTDLASVGVLTISANGDLSSELISQWDGRDAETESFLQDIQSQFDKTMEQPVGTSEVDLIAIDPETDTEIVRKQETNLGDFCCDAYLYATGADIAIDNGGGIRANLPAGELTYEDLLYVKPFANLICMIETSGQDILDALELGSMECPSENGSFLQVGGISYEVDTSVPSSVKLDDAGNFLAVEGEYRVKNVMVGNEPLDLTKTYTLVSHDYYLLEGGGGYTMFQNDHLLLDRVMLDYDCIVKYVTEALNGTIGTQYADPNGQNRITIK